jgi:hypothetical protein
MSVNVSDHTGQIWLSCFDEVGVAIMGMPANELMAMKEEGDDKRVGEVFSDANCKTFNFKCRAKMDNFQDQQRYVVSLKLKDFEFTDTFFAESDTKSNTPMYSTSPARRRS